MAETEKTEKIIIHEILPVLDKLPVALQTHFDEMIGILIDAASRGPLPDFRGETRIKSITAHNGEVRYLFKICSRESGIKEATTYLLDGKRSEPGLIYGFSNVLPTMFMDVTAGKETFTGIMVEYKDLQTLATCNFDASIDLESVMRVSILDIRIGNIDRSLDNLLVQPVENGKAKVIPIDHEYVYGNMSQQYNIMGAVWLRWLHKEGYHEALYSQSQHCLKYITDLDSFADLDFIRNCGLPFDENSAERLVIFDKFLKIAVCTQLPVLYIGRSVAFKCTDSNNCLQTIVEKANTDKKLLDDAIKERLEDFKQNLEKDLIDQ